MNLTVLAEGEKEKIIQALCLTKAPFYPLLVHRSMLHKCIFCYLKVPKRTYLIQSHQTQFHFPHLWWMIHCPRWLKLVLTKIRNAVKGSVYAESHPEHMNA